ncbi:protein kinase [Streptomyces sp. NPDC020742]|uniref:serine/threonine-protein kinase n=1 Tax=Streptomyces sp. NPDC020742 TaxID=3154897 RepID=UPI0033ECB723
MEQPAGVGPQQRPGHTGGPAPLRSGDPRRIGAYRLIGRLGEGGMGRVFLARSDRGRTVAVKLVREELANEEEFRARFRREVRAAQQVAGEWTAPVLDADTEAATPWLATGYIAGPSLQQVVGGGRTQLPERTVRILAAGLARALGAIHAAGVIHRDLKPSNVLITIDGPRVIDFGIARALEAVAGNGVTLSGATVGSPGFMSPEQVRGTPLTPACDVFALGSVLAYAATGRQPFGTPGTVAHAVMYRIAEEEPDLSGLPEGLHGLIAGCLAKDPAQRPTPAQLVALAEEGTERGPGADEEPWLPGALIARLGRHAVELLEAENPLTEDGLTIGPVEERAGEAIPGDGRATDNRRATGDGPGAPDAPAGEAAPDRASAADPVSPADPASTREPASPADLGVHALPTTVSPSPEAVRTAPPSPVPHGPASHPSPAPYVHPVPAPALPAATAPRRRRIATALLTVAALALTGAGATTAYTLLTEPGSAVRAEGTGTAGQGRTSAWPAHGAIPSDYLGTWETTVGDSATDVRQLTLTQGKTGDTVLRMTATGTTYRCEFAATLASAGPPVRLGPSTLLSGPADTCPPGESSTLDMVGGMLRRSFDDGRALSYRKTG